MRNRWFMAALLGASLFCSAQVSTRLYLKKDRFVRGEPVVLYAETTNRGSEGVNVTQSSAYGECSGYSIRLSSDPVSTESCDGGIKMVDCLSSDYPLVPGASHTEQVLLNFQHDIDASGAYEVDVSKTISYANAGIPFFKADKTVEKFHARLHFVVDDAAAVDPLVWADLAAQLRSADDMKRLEAARTLAVLAPPSLEATLFAFKDDLWLKQFAPMALYNLKSARSMAALAELMVKSEPGSYESNESARYLAASGDRQWFPLLKEMALKHAGQGKYLEYAAQSGGDDAIPLILEMSKDSEFRNLAVLALGYTGSRDAVPIAIGLVETKAFMAEEALGRLTHLKSSNHAGWEYWWKQNRASAKIYKAADCGELKVIP